jgi:hypothetical protein
MFPVNIGRSGRVLQLNSHSVTEEEDSVRKAFYTEFRQSLPP